MDKILDNLCVNNIRTLSMQEIMTANSGHSGIALCGIPILYALYGYVLNYDCKDGQNFFRDRFVLSAGHGSSMLYATMHLFGFDVSIDDLKGFRKLGYKTAGHPEKDLISGIDASTGPLGQGLANSVGMAIASKHYANIFNKPDFKLIDNKIFCYIGDGCLMEGISYEAMSLAGNLCLDNLIVIYDKNNRTIDGSLSITSDEDFEKRFLASGWNVEVVKDGNSVEEIVNTLLKVKNTQTKPTVIIVNTVLGYASDLEDNSKVHGTPLTSVQFEHLKQKLNIYVGEFEVLKDVKLNCEKLSITRKQNIIEKNEKLKEFEKKYPKDYENLINLLNKNTKNELDILKKFKTNDNQPLRDVNNQVLAALNSPFLMGGSADVEASTKVFNKNSKHISKTDFSGQNIYFGIRELAMSGICNGIALYGGLMSFYGAFLVFSDYVKPALRMTAIMNLPVLATFTHDSFYVGEDGVSHQPIEQISTLREIPNLYVFRPYNQTEVVGAYINFFKSQKPTVLILSKQNFINKKSKLSSALKGGYIISKEQKTADVIIIATGMDVENAIETQKILLKQKIDSRVVSMPCVELFLKQSKKYKEQILPKNAKIVTLEAGHKNGLICFKPDLSLSINEFGSSGNWKELVEKYGFSPKNHAKIIKNQLFNKK